MRLLILFSSIFLFSCQKIPEDNVYTPPNTIKELKNIIYLNVDIDKALQKIPSIINQNYSQDQNLFEFKIKAYSFRSILPNLLIVDHATVMRGIW